MTRIESATNSGSLGRSASLGAVCSDQDRWSSSGGRALTGHADGPGLDPPEGMTIRLDSLAASLATATEGSVRLDPLELVTERSRLDGLNRHGRTSCGGGSRLLRAADGWLAVSLARDDDVDLLPAWLHADPDVLPATYPVDEGGWKCIAKIVAERFTGELDEQAALLGLAVGMLPSQPPAAPRGSAPFDGLPVRAKQLGMAPARRPSEVTVADLSSLWAGPLCGRLLAAAGAQVGKVESVSRPDGARSGNPVFFDALNAMKHERRVDLATPEGVDELRRMLFEADVVIESTRPRALAQLGVDAASLVAAGPQVWVSITARGRSRGRANRVGYGDDAAVAGGLVAHDESGDPVFCADAVADPCSGLVAGTAVARALAHGGRWLVDIALTDVATHLAQGTSR